jgi:hypothetical protein
MGKTVAYTDKVALYFDPKTNLYARGTVANRQGRGKFLWKPYEKLPTHVKETLAIMLVFYDPNNKAGQRLEGVGSVKRSFKNPGLIFYVIYKMTWEGPIDV